jgi:hypothetical protein
MTKSKTQEIIDFIEQHGTVRLSVIRKEFKLAPSSVRAFLASAFKKGWVLSCALTTGEGEEQDEEYRIGTAYTRTAASKTAEEAIPEFGKAKGAAVAPFRRNAEPSKVEDEPSTEPDTTADQEAQGENVPNLHEQHARELLDALNRIHALEGELHEAKLPANWNPAAMVLQLQYLLASGVEILIGPTRLHILDGDARYEVSKPDELLQTIEAIQFLKERKAA